MRVGQLAIACAFAVCSAAPMFAAEALVCPADEIVGAWTCITKNCASGVRTKIEWNGGASFTFVNAKGGRVIARRKGNSWNIPEGNFGQMWQAQITPNCEAIEFKHGDQRMIWQNDDPPKRP
jgi:hypothetical protein